MSNKDQVRSPASHCYLSSIRLLSRGGQKLVEHGTPGTMSHVVCRYPMEFGAVTDEFGNFVWRGDDGEIRRRYVSDEFPEHEFEIVRHKPCKV